MNERDAACEAFDSNSVLKRIENLETREFHSKTLGEKISNDIFRLIILGSLFIILELLMSISIYHGLESNNVVSILRSLTITILWLFQLYYLGKVIGNIIICVLNTIKGGK